VLCGRRSLSQPDLLNQKATTNSSGSVSCNRYASGITISIKQEMERYGYSKQIGEDGWPVDANHPVNRRPGARGGDVKKSMPSKCDRSASFISLNVHFLYNEP